MDELLSREIEVLVPLLAAFDVTASQGHITRAAQLLDVPQSSLSRRLKTVEKTLGVQLFQPVGRGIALTAAGRELFDRTHHLVRSLDDALSVVRSNADPDSGLVRFGFPLTLGPISIPALLAEFHTAAPRIRLHLVQAHGEALVEQIHTGLLDLAVMIPAPTDLSAIMLGHQRIHLYVARDHRLAGRDDIDPSELSGEHFIANPPAFHLRGLFDSWCAAAGFTPHVVFEIAEFEAMRALVAHGLGIALLPEPETPHPDLHRITLRDAPRRTIGLVTGNHRPTPAVARLHEYLARHAPAQIDHPGT
ncbi:LysR family transcriptional regulator [Nocardia macrotermitis]|uniref:HTH-type transcriptional regulator GltC n=1 Tax=Nocardia macrotermitis TaxID=2585198 RepID=A0A7K0D8F0_9NOCA|nr:LysR family transcriptional regulator [Nocardia macrotermitis]MQY22065.1 HTH-type transcriptional regulator GltC [Nocardia macrotermitis]